MACRQCPDGSWVCGDVPCDGVLRMLLHVPGGGEPDGLSLDTLFGAWEEKGRTTIGGVQVRVFTRAWNDPGGGKIQTAVKIVPVRDDQPQV